MVPNLCKETHKDVIHHTNFTVITNKRVFTKNITKGSQLLFSIFCSMKFINCRSVLTVLSRVVKRDLLSHSITKGAYKFGKTKFPEFSRPSKHNYKAKT